MLEIDLFDIGKDQVNEWPHSAIRLAWLSRINLIGGSSKIKKGNGILSLDDSVSYIESITPSQRISRVATQVNLGRKRHLSETDISSTNKKQPRLGVKVKRTLYTETSSQSS